MNTLRNRNRKLYVSMYIAITDKYLPGRNFNNPIIFRLFKPQYFFKHNENEFSVIVF